MVFIVNYRATIIGSVIKGLVERPGKTACCSVVLKRCRLKHSYRLLTVLLDCARVDTTDAGAWHCGHFTVPLLSRFTTFGPFTRAFSPANVLLLRVNLRAVVLGPMNVVAVHARPTPCFPIPPPYYMRTGRPPANAGWFTLVVFHFFSLGGGKYHSLLGGQGTTNPL